MAELNLTLQLTSTETDDFPIQLANLLPNVITFEVHDDKVERSLTLDPTNWKLLESYELTPYVWFIVNIGKAADSTDNQLLVDFGDGTTPMKLDPGKAAFWWGDVKPVAKSATGNSRIFWAVFQAPAP